MRPTKKLFFISLLFLAGTSFYGCNEKDPEEEKVDFTISEKEIQFKTSGEIKNIEITSPGSWRSDLEEGEEWITVSPSAADKSSNVGIQVRANSTGETRTGVIYFYGGNVSRKLTVTQNGAQIEFSTRAIEFDEQGTPETITVSSNANWTMSNISEIEWLSSNTLSGEGEDFKLTFTPTTYTERQARGPQNIYFESFGVRDSITVSQRFPNTAPYAPKLMLPTNESIGVIIYPSFQWEEAGDPDGDIVTYRISISEDGINWDISKDDLEGNSGTCGKSLNANTTYYWKVTASDPFGGSTDSEVFRFTTSSSDRYLDGETIVYQEATQGAPKPVIIPFTGDGFIEEDFIYGGAFDQAMDTAIEAFFAVEPYKTYRNYFKVYKLAAYSEDRGVTVLNNMGNLGPNAKECNTAYSCTIVGGGVTRINCDEGSVVNYTVLIPEVENDEADLGDIAVQIIINENAYAGTCVSYTLGFSYAMSPMHTTEFTKLVNHEGGGHGFGRLADEYYSQATVTQERIDQVRELWRGDHPDGAYYYNANVDYSGSVETSHWYHYLSKPGYEAVGYYEGADLVSNGAWRPEYNSCMNNNVPYYNAPSREAIVRRLKRISGEVFSYDDFHAKDLIRSEALALGTTRAPEMVYPMTAPPVEKIGSPFDYIK